MSGFTPINVRRAEQNHGKALDAHTQSCSGTEEDDDEDTPIFYRHRDSHRWLCPECEKSYAVITEMKAHWDKAHTNVLGGICPVCSKVYVRTYTMRQHVNANHPEEEGRIFPERNPKNSCPYCPKLFITTHQRKRHIFRSHPEVTIRHLERDLANGICPVCEKQFTGPARVKNHIKWKHMPQGAVLLPESVVSPPFRRYDQLHTASSTQLDPESLRKGRTAESPVDLISRETSEELRTSHLGTMSSNPVQGSTVTATAEKSSQSARSGRTPQDENATGGNATTSRYLGRSKRSPRNDNATDAAANALPHPRVDMERSTKEKAPQAREGDSDRDNDSRAPTPGVSTLSDDEQWTIRETDSKTTANAGPSNEAHAKPLDDFPSRRVRDRVLGELSDLFFRDTGVAPGELIELWSFALPRDDRIPVLKYVLPTSDRLKAGHTVVRGMEEVRYSIFYQLIRSYARFRAYLRMVDADFRGIGREKMTSLWKPIYHYCQYVQRREQELWQGPLRKDKTAAFKTKNGHQDIKIRRPAEELDFGNIAKTAETPDLLGLLTLQVTRRKRTVPGPVSRLSLFDEGVAYLQDLAEVSERLTGKSSSS
ncbi:MAG: hypothetical protein M1837_002894 [Sclerophora amabilis]|nr:MAG: hypothetical protein M1837_002894 [Sclerophora amabilis]